VFPVRYELNLNMLCRRRRCIVFPVRYELNLNMLKQGAQEDIWTEEG
jgi:hypothetical protein